MKTLIISAFVLTFLFWGTALAQDPIFVEPLTSIGIQTSEAAEGGLSSYINRLYQYGVGLGAILAVLIIIYGGFRYMTSEAVGQKNAGREDIQRAVLGLLLVMSPVVVFSVINTNILNLDFGLQRIGDALDGSRGSSGTPSDNSCRVFPAGNTLIADADEARCCSAQTRPAGPNCNVVVNNSNEQICNCYGELNSFEYWQTLPITDAFGNDTGESCRQETISSHQNIGVCQRQEELLFGGTSNTLGIAQTLTCLGDAYNPPRPEATWNNVRDLPLCSDAAPTEVIHRNWRGTLLVTYSRPDEDFELEHRTGTLEIFPDPAGSIEEQEAQCLALIEPAALLSEYNTQELRDEINAESVSSIVVNLTLKSCTDFF